MIFLLSLYHRIPISQRTFVTELARRHPGVLLKIATQERLIGKPTKIIKLFGGPAGFEQAIKELEEQIYKVA